MQQQLARWIACILTLTFTVTKAEEGKNIVPSTLRSATVYRSGAELVHTATARLEQGNNELIIDDVSTTLDPSSIRVSCTGNVTIMSVSFSTEYLKPETLSPSVKKLQDSIESIKKEQAHLNVLVKSDNELLDLLNNNKSIAGTQTGVSMAELSKMVDYYRQKTIELRTELDGYADKIVRLRLIGDKLQNQAAEEEKKNSKTSGRVLLQLLSPLAGTYEFTLSYLTMAANWYPAYDLKMTKLTDSLHISYKAQLAQSSGLDWKHVKLSLSTSLPTQDGNAPVLKARFLRFVDVLAWMSRNNNALSNSLAAPAAKMMIRGTSGIQSEAADSMVFADVQRKMDIQPDLGDYLSINDNQTDVVFDIDIPYDVPGNGKEQGVVLKEYKVPCAYQYYAAPVADKDAYLLGKMQGWEKLNLLPGEATIMVEGTYVGKSYIDPGATQDTLNLTLGRDKRIVVRKEKVTDFSSVKFLGSNKKEVFTYEITVRNNKKEKVQLLLKDQYPISSDKDIEEELLDNGGASVNKDNGILTWTLELAPGESRKFRVSYSVKYPKDKTVNIN